LRSLQGIVDLLRQAIKGETDPHRIIRILKSFLVAPALHRFAQEAAANMVTHLLAENAKSWRQAAREAGKVRIIYEALRRELQGPVGGAVAHQIQRNAEIIKTLPLDIAERVTDFVSRESLKGRRAADIARDIQEMFPENSRARAQLIARTEVSKTSTALTRARAENIGLEWYEWRTSEDGRVRDSHRFMDRVLVSWNSPPQPERLIGEKNPPPPYHAGEIWNCRCYPAPLTGVDRVTWPHRVHVNGAVVVMAKWEFEMLNRGNVTMTA
jgi:SPP1 gp7 family putative phage head morphogenesis protein